MVCPKKTKSAAAVVATAASSMLQSYNATGSGAAPVPVATGAGTAALLATTNSDSTSAASAANTGVKGFNYGAFFLDYSAKKQSDFEYEFERAQDLTGTTGWTSARLYTMSE